VYQVDDIAMAGGIASNRVNVGIYPGLKVIEGDGRFDLFTGLNRGDPSDPMPGASDLTRWGDDTSPNSRSRLGNVTNVGLGDITLVGDDVRFLAQVRSPGWHPARVLTGPAFNPVAGNGAGARAAALPDGGLVSVSSELVSGIPQIVLRARRP